ncbi:MAG: TIR domain-containing protein [Clostridia bacterium]|nr:TIR domain-containing protein [Clostridia bacterium]MBR2289667.1 TIR domain-containing protein [Clostridia bacterium]
MKNVFFSFHYDNDVSRANVVRNSWVIRGNKDAGFIDKAEFEKIKAKGNKAVYDWIDNQLIGTSVTAVLIGEDTCNREFVRYELQQSFKRGNKIIGIFIHNIKDMRTGLTSPKGNTTFGVLGKDSRGNDVYFSQVAKTYDWIDDDGYNNFGKWIED